MKVTFPLPKALAFEPTNLRDEMTLITASHEDVLANDKFNIFSFLESECRKIQSH